MTRLIGEIAAAQFEQRRAFLHREVAEGRLAAAEANRRALPWLAIAARAGADLDDLYFEGRVWRPDGQGWRGERMRFTPEEICSPAEWREALADARDAAFRQTILHPSPRATDEARDLSLLARSLRVPAAGTTAAAIAA